MFSVGDDVYPILLSTQGRIIFNVHTYTCTSNKESICTVQRETE